MANLVTWERFKKTEDSDMRDQLLKDYLPLVKNVAGRMAAGFPKSVELNDLVNTGVIGLIEAFNKGLIKNGLSNPLYYNIKRMQELNLK